MHLWQLMSGVLRVRTVGVTRGAKRARTSHPRIASTTVGLRWLRDRIAGYPKSQSSNPRHNARRATVPFAASVTSSLLTVHPARVAMLAAILLACNGCGMRGPENISIAEVKSETKGKWIGGTFATAWDEDRTYALVIDLTTWHVGVYSRLDRRLIAPEDVDGVIWDVKSDPSNGNRWWILVGPESRVSEQQGPVGWVVSCNPETRDIHREFRVPFREMIGSTFPFWVDRTHCVTFVSVPETGAIVHRRVFTTFRRKNGSMIVAHQARVLYDQGWSVIGEGVLARPDRYIANVMRRTNGSAKEKREYAEDESGAYELAVAAYDPLSGKIEQLRKCAPCAVRPTTGKAVRSAGGEYVVLATYIGDRKHFRVYDVETLDFLWEMVLPQRDRVLDLSSDGTRMLILQGSSLVEVRHRGAADVEATSLWVADANVKYTEAFDGDFWTRPGSPFRRLLQVYSKVGTPELSYFSVLDRCAFRVFSARYTSDGRIVAITGDGEIREWDMRTRAVTYVGRIANQIELNDWIGTRQRFKVE